MTTTRPSRPRQLPVTDVPSRGGQVARGLLALVATVAIVVGVPLALYSGFGAPWPTEVPDGSWLTAQIDVDTMLSVLAVVVWLAWAHFCVCLVVEAVNERGVRGLAPRVPGGGIGTQGLARRLVASIVLLVGTASVTMPSASAVAAGHDQQQPVSYSAASIAPTMDSAIAAVEELPSVAELDDATKADVSAQDEGVTTYYDVKPPQNRNYDTLWDIAERYLGDGLRYKELYAMNKGETQPDGRTLTQPDLIHPGWVLKMPSDAKGPGLKVVENGVRGPVAPPPTTPAPTAPDTPQAPDTADAPDTAAASETGSESAIARWTPLFGVAGGLLAGGLALRLRRHRAALGTAALWATRGAGPDPDPTPDGPPPGTRLREEADVDGARWLDRALRAWGSAHGPVPAPSRCSVADSGVVMAFSDVPDMDLPHGWTSSDDGRTWSLARDVVPPRAAGTSPLPGLVTVGRRDDGALLLLDLESAPGPMSLGGDHDVARAVAMSIAVDTATHPWADDRLVTLVGFADDVTAVAPDSFRRVDDVGRVLDSLENVAREQRAACRRADTFSAREARVRGAAGASWTYHLVVCSGVPDADDLDRLCELAGDQQVSLGVVVVGDTPQAALRVAALPTGRLSASYLGIDIEAQQLGVDASRVAGSLIPAAPTGAPRVDLGDLAAALGAGVDAAGASSPAVTVGLLGPIRIEGAGEPEPDRVELWTEVVAFLALHPDGVHVNRLTSAVWPRGVGDDVRDATLAAVAGWLGEGDDGPRLRTSEGIVSLDPDQVAVDWDRFRTALNRGAETTPTARAAILREALSLVRGRAWHDLPDGRYGWLASSTAETDMPLAVGLTARVVAEQAAHDEDGDAARTALQHGLRMSPASEELWRAALRLAERFGGRGGVREVADHMYAAIAEHGSPMGASAQTDALVDELLPGYRTRAA